PHASTFNVNPIQLHLSEGGSSTLLTVHNTSDEEIRFQLTTYAWSQSDDGKVELGPTRDIIFFPRIMKLEPGAKRKVRIGMAKSAMQPQDEASSESTPVERTYRIFVEELPSRKTKAAAEQVQVLTRMSIPIFIAPPKQMVKLTMGKASVHDGRFRFDVRNDGTVHTMLKSVKATAVSKGNKPLFSRDLAGWYLLASDVRTFEVEIPRSLCGKISHFEVMSASDGESEISLRYDVPSGACASQ
ncbi:MAG: molecular chaperone, partial [Polyangiales bacterium]